MHPFAIATALSFALTLAIMLGFGFAGYPMLAVILGACYLGLTALFALITYLETAGK